MGSCAGRLYVLMAYKTMGGEEMKTRPSQRHTHKTYESNFGVKNEHTAVCVLTTTVVYSVYMLATHIRDRVIDEFIINRSSYTHTHNAVRSL